MTKHKLDVIVGWNYRKCQMQFFITKHLVIGQHMNTNSAILICYLPLIVIILGVRS
jgi:hypothetical protein